jgi:hypothetical protein
MRQTSELTSTVGERCGTSYQANDVIGLRSLGRFELSAKPCIREVPNSLFNVRLHVGSVNLFEPHMKEVRRRPVRTSMLFDEITDSVSFDMVISFAVESGVTFSSNPPTYKCAGRRLWVKPAYRSRRPYRSPTDMYVIS